MSSAQVSLVLIAAAMLHVRAMMLFFKMKPGLALMSFSIALLHVLCVAIALAVIATVMRSVVR